MLCVLRALEPFDPGFCGNRIGEIAVELGSLLGVLTLSSMALYSEFITYVCIPASFQPQALYTRTHALLFFSHWDKFIFSSSFCDVTLGVTSADGLCL